MTERDDYINNRAAYVEGDTRAMVKCITCSGMFPEDEAVLFEGEYQCEECAEHSGLRRCAWCGEWGYWHTAKEWREVARAKADNARRGR